MQGVCNTPSGNTKHNDNDNIKEQLTKVFFGWITALPGPILGQFLPLVHETGIDYSGAGCGGYQATY